MSVLNEARWWGRAVLRMVNSPGLLAVVVALLWLAPPWGLGVVLTAAALTAGLRLWASRAPASYLRSTSLFSGHARARNIKRNWPEVCRRCGLVAEECPVVVRQRVSWPHVEFQVAPIMGQTVEDFETVVEPLRTAFGASRLRIQPVGVRDVLLTFTVGDYLRAAFSAVPDEAPDDLSSVLIGRREDGQPWRLALGPHTLVAGSSGAGKGSVFWSFAFGLAGAVRSGTVQLHGIDLKGGMEIMMGRGLFTTSATNALEAVALLEDLVERMQERSARYAGRLRSHTATVDEPLHIVMIDELAALTAYNNERELQRRAETAINLLCSQGRAPGFMVFACLQDPRKEVIPSRGLFTQMVGLRLKDISETTMVLGELAALSGAHCHRITRDVPGTGYVLPEDGSHPIRVRAGYASDESIRDVASRFASPVQGTVDVSSVEESLTLRRPRPRSREDVA